MRASFDTDRRFRTVRRTRTASPLLRTKPARIACATLPLGLRHPRNMNPSSSFRRTANTSPKRGFAGERKKTGNDYQLAFLTPGIRPFDAISRNWIRLMPN